MDWLIYIASLLHALSERCHVKVVLHLHPRVCEGLLHRESLLAAVRPQVVKQVSEHLVNRLWSAIGGSLPKQVRSVPDYQLVMATVSGLIPGVFTQFEYKEDGSEREHVHFMRVIVDLCTDFWGHIGATSPIAPCDVACLVRGGETPVNDLQFEVGVEADVLWFQVPMTVPIVLHVLHSIEKLPRHISDLVVLEGL